MISYSESRQIEPPVLSFLMARVHEEVAAAQLGGNDVPEEGVLEALPECRSAKR